MLDLRNGFQSRELVYNITMPKNITNGEFVLDYNEEDKVDERFKLMRAPNSDSLDFLRHQNQKVANNFYIENIRTGQFTQISENYMIESTRHKSEDQIFTTNSFETEMKLLFVGFQEKMNKLTTFFQGLFTGMALLYTITLNLSLSVSTDLVRVEDQSLRVVAILSSLGAMYSFLIAKQKYDFIKTRGTSSEIDRIYKSLILSIIQMVFYTMSYIIYNVSHVYAVHYNISGEDYSNLGATTTTYTVICIIAWIFTNVNTYKYEI